MQSTVSYLPKSYTVQHLIYLNYDHIFWLFGRYEIGRLGREAIFFLKVGLFVSTATSSAKTLRSYQQPKRNGNTIKKQNKTQHWFYWFLSSVFCLFFVLVFFLLSRFFIKWGLVIILRGLNTTRLKLYFCQVYFLFCFWSTETPHLHLSLFTDILHRSQLSKLIYV